MLSHTDVSLYGPGTWSLVVTRLEISQIISLINMRRWLYTVLNAYICNYHLWSTYGVLCCGHTTGLSSLPPVLDEQTEAVQFSPSVVSNSASPWTTARQASLSITNSQNLLKLMSMESVMPSNHLILCCPLLLLPSIFPSIRVFSNESLEKRP